MHSHYSLGSRPSPFRVRLNYVHAANIRSKLGLNYVQGTGKAWNRGYSHHTKPLSLTYMGGGGELSLWGYPGSPAPLYNTHPPTHTPY